MSESMSPARTGVESTEKDLQKKGIKKALLMALAAAVANGVIETGEAQERVGEPWYESGTIPATLQQAFDAEQEFLGPDNKGYTMHIGGELGKALKEVGLPTDYNHRFNLSMYLTVNGKGLFPNAGGTNPYTIDLPPDSGPDDVYIGGGKQNEILAKAVEKNKVLFKDGLTAEEVKKSWK